MGGNHILFQAFPHPPITAATSVVGSFLIPLSKTTCSSGQWLSLTVTSHKSQHAETMIRGRPFPCCANSEKSFCMRILSSPRVYQGLRRDPTNVSSYFICSIGYVQGGSWSSWRCDHAVMGGTGSWSCWKEGAHISPILTCEDSPWPNQSHPGNTDTQRAIPASKENLGQKAGPAGGLQWAFNLFNHW